MMLTKVFTNQQSNNGKKKKPKTKGKNDNQPFYSLKELDEISLSALGTLNAICGLLETPSQVQATHILTLLLPVKARVNLVAYSIHEMQETQKEEPNVLN